MRELSNTEVEEVQGGVTLPQTQTATLQRIYWLKPLVAAVEREYFTEATLEPIAFEDDEELPRATTPQPIP